MISQSELNGSDSSLVLVPMDFSGGQSITRFVLLKPELSSFDLSETNISVLQSVALDVEVFLWHLLTPV